MGPPSDVRWFINPMNTIVIGTINQFVTLELCEPQLSYRTRGPHVVRTLGNVPAVQNRDLEDPGRKSRPPKSEWQPRKKWTRQRSRSSRSEMK